MADEVSDCHRGLFGVGVVRGRDRAAALGKRAAAVALLLGRGVSPASQTHPRRRRHPRPGRDARAPGAETRHHRRHRRARVAGRQVSVPRVAFVRLGEHRVFFGRNIDIQKIAEELRSPASRSRSILAVVGPSGCGKSSLVRAGVLPRIAGQRDWLPLVPMVPGIDPLPRLARELAAAARRLDVDVTPLRGDVSGDTIAKVANDLCWRRTWTANASCWS